MNKSIIQIIMWSENRFIYIQNLVEKGILRRADEGGRSTNYELVEN